MISRNIELKIANLIDSWWGTRDVFRAQYPKAEGKFLVSNRAQNTVHIPVFNVTSCPRHSDIETVIGCHAAIIQSRSLLTYYSMRAITTFAERWSMASSECVKIQFKGEWFYCGYGYLCDEDMNPLIVFTVSAKRVTKADKTKAILYHSPTLHIAPKMLQSPIWSKYIINYFIPLCQEKHSLVKLNYHLNRKCFTNQSIDVQVHDLSCFMLKIRQPEITDNIQELVTEAVSGIAELPNCMNI